MAEPFIQAGRYAWFGVYPTLGEVKAVSSTEPKAVLEHRAPKTSFQSFTVEAQRVGRARSPLRAGSVTRTRLRRLESCCPRSYERGYSGACIFEGAVNPALEGDAGSEPAAMRGSACTRLWAR